MKFPEWIKPAVYGAGAGAVALAIIGFSWGGWMTGGSAAEMSEKQANSAVVDALMPYCLEKASLDPRRTAIMADIKVASTFKRRGLVEDAGWATPLGADGPNRALAQACYEALNADA